MIKLVGIALLGLLVTVVLSAASRPLVATDAPPGFTVTGSAAAVQPQEQEGWTQARVFQHVTAQARELSGSAYQAPPASVPAALKNMDYTQYRAIRFRPDKAIWNDEALFKVQLFHPGFLYQHAVPLSVVEDGQMQALAFDSDMFRYDGRAAPLAEKALNATMGFAGFRLHYPLNTAEHDDEFVVFLGASYFRLVGRGQVYGLSARGLAIDTASPSGEEFPAFREFWLIKPESEATAITVYALLDSPSVTGAYRFVIEPLSDAVIHVDARLFARSDVGKLGVAPLTSMFFYGESSIRKPDDFRPQVHDSDGLLVHGTSGEWMWRPLSNPARLRVTSLRDHEPRGFGLVQRDRRFDNYLDMEAAYHRRPSLWVSLGEGDWGAGGVELVEIPTASEINDNIVAYWVPQNPFLAGEQRQFQYRLNTFGSRLAQQNLAKVVRTRSGWAAIPGQADPPPRSHRRFIVDFRGDELDGLAESQPVVANLTTSSGEIRDLQIMRLVDGNTWRASFALVPSGTAASDMRLYLALRGRPISETWTYVWYPDEL